MVSFEATESGFNHLQLPDRVVQNTSDTQNINPLPEYRKTDRQDTPHPLADKPRNFGQYCTRNETRGAIQKNPTKMPNMSRLFPNTTVSYPEN